MASYCQCAGLTLRGIRCKRIVYGGKTHCYQHIKVPVVQPVVQPVIVPVDAVAHAEAVRYYRYDDTWPDMNEIIHHESFKVYDQCSLFIEAVQKFDNFILFNSNDMELNTRRRIFIFSFELLRLNKELYVKEQSVRNLFKVFIKKLSEVSYMSEYREQFHRDIDSYYREKKLAEELAIKKLVSKRKYIEHIFKGSMLGPLNAMKIAELYTE